MTWQLGGIGLAEKRVPDFLAYHKNMIEPSMVDLRAGSIISDFPLCSLHNFY